MKKLIQSLTLAVLAGITCSCASYKQACKNEIVPPCDRGDRPQDPCDQPSTAEAKTSSGGGAQVTDLSGKVPGQAKVTCLSGQTQPCSPAGPTSTWQQTPTPAAAPVTINNYIPASKPEKVRGASRTTVALNWINIQVIPQVNLGPGYGHPVHVRQNSRYIERVEMAHTHDLYFGQGHHRERLSGSDYQSGVRNFPPVRRMK